MIKKDLDRVITPVIAMVVIGLCFALIFAVLFFGVQTEERDIVLIIVGAVLGYIGTIIQFYLGSSKGSKDKNEVIRKLEDNKDA